MKPPWFKRTIIVATTEFEKDAVLHVQRVLRCDETGQMDEGTRAHIRGLQQLFGLNASGILDEETAKQVERIRNYGSVQ